MRRTRPRTGWFIGFSATVCALLVGATVTSTGAAGATKAVTATGMASLTFDDGQLGQYTYARPVLRAAGVHGTFYIISDALGWAGTNMGPKEVKTLAAEGDEIGSHTRDHADLTQLSPEQITAEFSDAQKAIAAKTGVTPKTCAYPYGATNATVQSIAAKYLKGCRGTAPGVNAGNTLTTYNLLVYYVQTDTTAQTVAAVAKQAKATKTWVIFVYHGVGAVGSSDDVTAATFKAHVQALKNSGISIKTVSAALTALGH